jgi:putative ABC transport system permease protein
MEIEKLGLDARTQDEEINLILSGEFRRRQDQLLMFKVMLMIISGVIVMLITFTNTIEKSKDIAILKVLGTPTRIIIGMIIQEAILIGIIGAIVGSILINLMEPRFPMPLALRTGDIVVVFIGALVLCAMGSLLAVRRALSIDPMVAMGR